RVLSRLRKPGRRHRRGGRRLQGRRRPVRVPVSAHRGPLQRREPRNGRRRQARRRPRRRKKAPRYLAAGSLGAVRHRQMTRGVGEGIKTTRRANHFEFFDDLCPAPLVKIFWFSEDPNHFISVAVLSRKRGVGHRHERWDGMRWTRGALKTKALSRGRRRDRKSTRLNY